MGRGLTQGAGEWGGGGGGQRDRMQFRKSYLQGQGLLVADRGSSRLNGVHKVLSFCSSRFPIVGGLLQHGGQLQQAGLGGQAGARPYLVPEVW